MQCNKHNMQGALLVSHNTDGHAQCVTVTFLVLQLRNATLADDPVVTLLQAQAAVDREPQRPKVRWQLDGFAAV